MAKRKSGRGKGMTRGEQLRAAAGGSKPAAKGRGKPGAKSDRATGSKTGSKAGSKKAGSGGGGTAGAQSRREPAAPRQAAETADMGVAPEQQDQVTADYASSDDATRDGAATEQGVPDHVAPDEAPIAVRSSDEGAARGVFRLGAVPGATPGKWIQRWRRQEPGIALELVPIAAAAQRESLDAGDVDAAIVRLPLAGDAESVHVIGLYDEVPVVVASIDSSLLAAEELTPGDLAGEVLITPLDDVLGPLGLPTTAPSFAPLATTEDAIATAATGVGIVVVPMSLARLHHRRDVEFRPLVSAPGAGPLVTASVGFAWRRDNDSDAVQAFVGITRGRTARSSR